MTFTVISFSCQLAGRNRGKVHDPSRTSSRGSYMLMRKVMRKGHSSVFATN